jgi:hypothetical protein
MFEFIIVLGSAMLLIAGVGVILSIMSYYSRMLNSNRKDKL